jgi:hypothetical protein
MPFNVRPDSPVVIVGVLVAVIWFATASNPEVRAAVPWFFAAGVAFTLFLVGIGHIQDKRQHRAIERTLNRLLALRHSKDDSAVAEAEALYAELRQPNLQKHINESKDFIEATRTAGPHQVACLRLTIHHAWTGEEPWCGILRDHEALLRASELTPRERKRLGELVAPPA